MNDPYSPETEQQRRARHVQAREMLMQLSALNLHPGWKVFQEFVKGLAEAAESRLFTEESPQLLAKCAGQLASLRAVQVWLDAQQQDLAQMLQAETT